MLIRENSHEVYASFWRPHCLMPWFFFICVEALQTYCKLPLDQERQYIKWENKIMKRWMRELQRGALLWGGDLEKWGLEESQWTAFISIRFSLKHSFPFGNHPYASIDTKAEVDRDYHAIYRLSCSGLRKLLTFPWCPRFSIKCNCFCLPADRPSTDEVIVRLPPHGKRSLVLTLIYCPKKLWSPWTHVFTVWSIIASSKKISIHGAMILQIP